MRTKLKWTIFVPDEMSAKRRKEIKALYQEIIGDFYEVRIARAKQGLQDDSLYSFSFERACQMGKFDDEKE